MMSRRTRDLIDRELVASAWLLGRILSELTNDLHYTAIIHGVDTEWPPIMIHKQWMIHEPIE